MDRALLFDFEREPIMEHCKKLASTDEQIKYLRLVLKEYKTNPPDLDPNYGLKPRLTEYLKTEIEFRKETLEEPRKSIETTKIELNQNKDEFETEIKQLNNELSNAHTIIRKKTNRIKVLEQGITREDMYTMIKKNKCEFKNGKINYSALGKILGCSHHTAKEKCKFFDIK